jgi:VCBS repeat-containing protein
MMVPQTGQTWLGLSSRSDPLNQEPNMPSVNRSSKSARLNARKSPRANKLHARRCLIESLEERTVLASTISGFAYVDSNNDGARGASEMGVPGVQITLTGNNVTRTALTNNSGAYSFTNLPDGAYSLAELQPTALADGVESSGVAGPTVGNDQFSNVTVSGTQTVANMNFGERGVKPQFAGIQCFFASAESQDACFREIVATAEERAGNSELAAAIRAGDATVNRAPVANNNTYSATGGQTLTVTAANGVLTNDTDADGNALTAALVSNVTNGTLTLNANGSFTYTPNASFSGTDTFTYRANDGAANSNNATVTITVTANAAPVANNDTFTATEDTTLTIAAAGVLSNDTDANGNALTAAIVTQAANGTATLNANGSFTYIPNANFAGTDTFTYRANDGFTNSANATVTINVTAVNDAPVATNDTYNVTSGVAFTTTAANGVRANDNDVENNALTVALVDNVTNGTLTLNADGSFTYTSAAGFTGAATFTYRVSDGTSNSNTATVTLNVAANTAPVANNDNYTIAEDGTLTVPLATGVLTNDTDANGNALTAAVVATTTNGTLTLNADGSFTYVPNPNFNGTDTFTYKANDGQTDSPNATVTITVSAVNDTPVANGDSYSTGEDATLTVPVATGVLLNDTDADTNATLTATVVATTTHGELTLNPDGSFTYVPAANFNGTDTFTYTVSDGTATSAAATVTITITAAADAPVALNDTFTMAEDGTLTVPVATGVLANDTDAEGSSLTATLVQDVTHGTLTFNADGSFTYVPDVNFNGTDTFTYRANDGTANSNVATVTITISAVNDAPVANNESYASTAGTTLTINATNGVLANDTDLDANALTAAVVATTTDGTLTLNPDGSFTYVPDEGFTGTDTFTYRANDGTANSAEATVTITVGANVPPVAVLDTYETDEDTTLSVTAANGVLANDTDVNVNQTLTAILVAGPATGTFNLAADGSFTYVPVANASGPITFTYKANDGTADSSVVTVTINVTAVNDPPVGEAKTYDAAEDTQLVVDAANGLLQNATDVEGDTLTAALTGTPVGGTPVVAADGSFTFTPAANFTGAASFQYVINDGTDNSVAYTVTINVAGANDAPVAASDTYQTATDVELVISAPGVLANDTDADGDALTATLVVASGPASGTLTFNADGSFTYLPDSGFRGTDTFSYVVNDGTIDSAPATVTITVNTAPVAQDDAYNATVGVPLTIAAPGVLTNDTDANSDPLTAVLIDQATNGNVTLAPDGSFVYTPNADFTGEDTFTYRANDGLADSALATVTITVTPANVPPVAVLDTYETDEDTTLTVTAANGVLANDTDVDANQTLTAILVAGPATGTFNLAADGSFTYVPVANASGPITFTYKANDGTADSNVVTVTITVAAVNDAPVGEAKTYDAAEDTQLVIDAANGLLQNATDVEGDQLTAALTGTPVGGTPVVAADGSFTFTPAANFTGAASFQYVINDGADNSVPYTVTINVAGTNDAPVAASDTYQTATDVELVISAPGVLANDTDADGDALTVSLVAASGPANGEVTLNANGSFTYTPDSGFRGTDSFSYVVNDGTIDSAPATVTITVNTAPVAQNDAYNATAGVPLTIAAPGVLSNDTDANNDSLTAVLVDQATNGNVVLAPDGSFVYTPNADFTGEDTFTYRANDGLADSALATVTITVAPVNLAPVAVDDTYNTDEDMPLVVPVATGVLFNDTDAENDNLTAAVVAGPTSGDLTLNGDGSFTYTPNASFNGSDSFTYRVNDGTNDSNVATVTITIDAVNDAPVAANTTFTATEDTGLSIDAANGVLSNATDEESDPLTATLVADSAVGGSVVLNSDGSFTFTPATNFTGAASFQYVINDGTDDSAPYTATINVSPVNDAPTGTDDSYSTAEETLLTIAAPGVLANDTDVDGDSITVTLVATTTSGTLTLDPDGSFTYLPNQNFFGADTFTYQVNDGQTTSSNVTVTIQVTNVNDAPIAAAQTYTTPQDTTLNEGVPGLLAGATDNDGGDILTALKVTDPTNGTVTVAADGSFTYVPDAGFAGEDSFTYKINDGTIDSAPATVTITVTPPPTEPQGEAPFEDLFDAVFGVEDEWLL